MLSQISEREMLKRFNWAFQQYELVQVSGKAGSCKTNLTVFLISRLLKVNETCVWVQASDTFPMKRLEQMNQSNINRLKVLKEKIILVPDKGTITTIPHQKQILQELTDIYLDIDPNLKYVVIDNISHHLRYHLSLETEIVRRERIINDFFEFQLFPLVIKCSIKGIVLFLIHEVSSNPETGEEHIFYSTLFEKLNGIKINLSFTKVRMDSIERTLNLFWPIKGNEYYQSTLKFIMNIEGFSFFLP